MNSIRPLPAAALILLMLARFAVPNAQASTLLYVTMTNNTIVTYDTTSNDGATIGFTKVLFASSNLSGPLGLAFDSTGNLYAANANTNTISKFDPSGAYVSNITSNLNGPLGLAFDSTGNLYASNIGGTISKFDSSGAYVSNITSNLNGPYGLAFDSAGNLYASNIGTNTISKFDSSGAYVSNITSNLNTPYGLAFDSAGNLYAANKDNTYAGNTTISKFDSSGAYVSNITSNLDSPIGLAFDSTGNLYAANASNTTISKFDSSGTFLTSWSTGGGNSSPRYLAFSPSAVAVPEPGTVLPSLLLVCGGVYIRFIRRHRAPRRRSKSG